MKKILAALFLLPLTASLAPAQNAAPDLAAAKNLWEGNNTQCRNCHGKLGEGAYGPDLAGRGLSAAQFQQAVRKPWGIMPAFTEAQLSDADLAGLTAYFNSLPRNPTPAAWRFAPDTSVPHGQQVFLNMGCAQCHGPTFDIGRGTLGGIAADFPLFQKIVYTHTTAMPEVEEMIEAGNPPPAAPPPGGARPAPPLRMGNFNPARVAESQLREMFDWMKNDIGFRPMMQGRLTAASIGPNGATYTLNLANNGLKGKGLTAEGLTVALAIPAGATVVSTTGDGYKGVRMDAQAKANVAEWQVPRMAPQDRRAFTITLSKPGTTADNVKGTVRWSKPGPKTGPNLDVQNIAPAPVAPT